MIKQKAYIKNNDLEKSIKEYLKRIRLIDEERIETTKALGRVLSKEVYALCSDPMFNAAAMDGIQVHSSKTIKANEKNPIRLKIKEDFEYVNTGGEIKAKFDSVIMIEDVHIIDEESIEIIVPSHPWQHIRVAGESVVVTEMILAKNSRIRAVDIGAILASGNDEVVVYRKPKVGIIVSGDELVKSAKEIKKGKLREYNSHVFSAFCEDLGAEAKIYDIVKDNLEALKEAVKKAAGENDIVIVNAGSSAGSKDYTVVALEQLGEVFVHGLAIKPGKPTIFSFVNNKPVIGVPGYPVSAYIVFEKVVARVIRKMMGEAEEIIKECVNAKLTKKIISTLKNREFVRVSLGEVDGTIVATPLARGAAAIMSLVKADGIISVDRSSEGYNIGDLVEVELKTTLNKIKKSLVIVGSHDILIDVISNTNKVASAHVGSLAGLLALKDGYCHIAPIHLLDEDSGEYNKSYVKKHFKDNSMALIKVAKRVQGIVQKKGLNVESIEDIKKRKLMFANRQQGSGSRILFDYLLGKNNIKKGDILGYEKEFTTHLAVAMAIDEGMFDCGLAIEAVANMLNLDFVEVAQEEYDFLIKREILLDERVKGLIETLKSKEFKDKLRDFGGYITDRSGEIEYI